MNQLNQGLTSVVSDTDERVLLISIGDPKPITICEGTVHQIVREI